MANSWLFNVEYQPVLPRRIQGSPDRLTANTFGDRTMR